MRIALVSLMLAGCAASTAPNGTADQSPPQMPAPQAPAPAPQGPVMTAESFRPAIEANEAPFRVPGNVTAHLNEEVRIGDVRVKPLEVLEDSRCPPDVSCVWAGRVRLRLEVGGVGEQVIGTDQPLNVAGGRRLMLVGVAPINWATPPAGVDPHEPKRFAFRLSGTD